MPKNKNRYKEYLINISLLLIALVISLLILEFTVRQISPSVFHPGIDLNPNMNKKFDVNIAGISPSSNFTTNKWGFRGDPIPKNIDEYYFILAIGGSTTKDTYIDNQKTWTYLLQERLKNSTEDKILVHNAGISGHSTRGHLLFMKTVVPEVKPNMIIFLVGANDLVNSLIYDSSEQNPWETTSPIYYIFTKSRLMQIAYSWKQILFGELLPESEITRVFVLKKMAKPETELSENFKDELISLPDYERNLNEIIRIGKENDIRILFLTQPLLYEDNEYWSDIESHQDWIPIQRKKYYLSAQTLAKMLNIFNNKLLEVCDDTDSECFDLASKIPHSHDYFYDSVHYNEAGARLVATEIFDYLIEKNGTPLIKNKSR